jgi:hypothetical protein
MFEILNAFHNIISAHDSRQGPFFHILKWLIIRAHTERLPFFLLSFVHNTSRPESRDFEDHAYYFLFLGVSEVIPVLD